MDELMEVVNIFVTIFNYIREFLFDIIDILLFIPKFITNSISIFPSEIQLLFGTIITLICIAFIYRFIR